MNNWPVYKIENICDIKSGKRIPLGFDFVINETQHPYIRARDIKNGRINTDDLIYLDDSTFAKIKKYIIEENDIAITIVGASIGDIGFATKEVNGFNLTENAVRLTNFKDNVSSQYLFYLLVQNQYKEFMQTIAGGAAQPKLGIYKIQRIKVQFPPLPTQQKIASILSAYDNLIQNYKKQIEALQTAASELYKEWFVRFRFPGYQTTKFENGIPEGWKVEKLFDVAKIIYGYPFNSDEFCDDSTLNPVVRIRDILDNHTDTYTSESCDEKYWINPNEMLIGMDGIFHMTLWTGERALQNQRTVRVISKVRNLSNYYLYFSLYPQIKALEQMIVGTTVAHLGDKHLKKITILIPAEKILKMSYEKFEPMMNRIYSLQQQITNLTQQRDLLLPRLMSGKLEVK